MDHEQIKQLLKQILTERLGIDPADVNATDDASLFSDDGWGIDSVDSLDLVLGIEKTFGVRITQDAHVMKHFKSLNTLAAFIHAEMTAETSQPVA
jgi:acyl carrier protein